MEALIQLDSELLKRQRVQDGGRRPGSARTDSEPPQTSQKLLVKPSEPEGGCSTVKLQFLLT